jgi:hypothetical protein
VMWFDLSRRLRAASLAFLLAVAAVLPMVSHGCNTVMPETAVAAEASDPHAGHRGHAGAELPGSDHSTPEPCDCLDSACCVAITPWTGCSCPAITATMAAITPARFLAAPDAVPARTAHLLPFAIGPPVGAFL